MLSSIAGLAFLVGILFALHIWSQDMTADPAERKVFETGFNTILGGAIINAGCAAVVWSVAAVPVGEEFGACSPYGLAGSAVAARLHLYKNGFSPREWEYFKDMPNIVLHKLGGLTDLALDRLDDELLRHGIISEKPSEKRKLQQQRQAEQDL